MNLFTYICTYTEIFRYTYVIEHYITQIENIRSQNIEYIENIEYKVNHVFGHKSNTYKLKSKNSKLDKGYK